MWRFRSAPLPLHGSWNHANMPALQCPNACLVSVTMHNGTAVGYTSPSTIEKFASTVGGTLWVIPPQWTRVCEKGKKLGLMFETGPVFVPVSGTQLLCLCMYLSALHWTGSHKEHDAQAFPPPRPICKG